MIAAIYARKSTKEEKAEDAKSVPGKFSTGARSSSKAEIRG